MSVDNDDKAFEEQWKAVSDRNSGWPSSLEGIAATSPLLYIVSKRYAIKLIIADGLSVALARTDKELENAAHELEADMSARDTTSGVVVLSQDLASQTFGPVSDELIDKGISWHRSTNVDVIYGAVDFINKYFQIRDITRPGLIEEAGY